MIKNLRFFVLSVCALLAGTAMAGSITFGELGLENGVQYTDPFDGGDFTVTFGGGGNNGKYYTTGEGIRVYGDGTMTIAAKEGKLKNILITYDGSNKPTEATVVDGGTYDPATGLWTGDASQILAAQTIQMGNGVTRYIINLNESSNYASFQMKVTGNVVNMSSENASLRTKETADGYRVLGFAKNNAFNGSELLVIDVKGVAQFSNITLATLNATSVAGMLDDATGIANVTIDESEARYDLSGKKLNKQTTGVNIVRGADGKVRKVMVK